MKIVLGLGSLDYANIAAALLPLIKPKEDGSLTGRLIAAAAKLPAEPLAQLLDALPQKEKDDIAVCLVAEKEEKLLELGNKLLVKQDIPLTISALSLSDEMELSVTVSDTDYAALARRFLPLIPVAVLDEHPATKALTAVMKLPSRLLYVALEKLPREKLESAAVQLMGRYESAILSKLSSAAKAHGLLFTPSGLRAER